MVSIDRTHPVRRPPSPSGTTASISMGQQARHSCIPISTHVKPNEALRHVQDFVFCPNPASTCATVANNPAPQMEIHGGSALRALMNSDRTPEIHYYGCTHRPLVPAEYLIRYPFLNRKKQ
ncbi:hypothetical protein CEXT_574401 [Caerostris extrusa]|uniref:Uncharacterized protein n=1 Tax=Caerostris extrusa TaxID=172846 RepID=A0AAV4XX02_CAEEX|nr:hypothetical protein CEXT_574401 [Caerostris extrusa]